MSHAREGFWFFLGTVVTLTIGALTVWSGYRIGVAQTAAEYIKTLGDQGAPPYAKMVAISAMLEKRLVDTDILFDAAYALEDQYKTRVTLQLLYVVADRGTRTRSPIGYVDQPLGDTLQAEDGFYRIWGWGLDANGPVRVQLLADGKEVNGLGPKRFARPDVADVFHQFADESDRLNSGFTFEIPTKVAAGKVIHITVRLWNRHSRFREILSRQVKFASP